MSIAISVLAILVSLLSIALNAGWLNRWIIFVTPAPTGFKYWPWAVKYTWENGRWPL